MWLILDSLLDTKTSNGAFRKFPSKKVVREWSAASAARLIQVLLDYRSTKLFIRLSNNSATCLVELTFDPCRSSFGPVFRMI
jgi:hypothetical protein